MVVALFAILGLLVGSFLTVVVHRVPARQSIVAPRSRCPRCGAQLRAVDNVPVLSYVILRGKCRNCGLAISPIYPLIEVATAGLFVGAAVAFHRPLVQAMVAAFLAVVLALGIIDVQHRVIPNRITYPAVVAFAVLIGVGDAAGGGVDAVRAAIGMGAYGGGLLLVALVSPKGMGMGDVKLGALIGLVLGSLALSRVAVAAGAAILAGGVGAVVALAAGGSRKQALPFGPYLALGAVVAAFAGPQIAHAYLRLFP
ncbi:MAG: prepilin peptidase [Actinomycetota bacterium]|nr:prepilin peptidase [Actinomycetota bacterium]